MKYVLREINDKICVLTINRPKQLNALNGELIAELNNNISWIQDQKNIRVVILTGSGDKAFIAGADIAEMSSMSSEDALEFSKLGQELTLKIENLQIPVIAAINGFALGGGCEFALSFHIRLASDNAIFGQPEVGLGLIAGFGGTQRLPKIIGKGLALELLITGRHINAKEAKEIGIVNVLCKQEELLSKSMEMAKLIATKSPLAIKQTLFSINNGNDMDINDGLRLENSLFSKLFKSNDPHKGLTAFVDKVSPKFDDLK